MPVKLGGTEMGATNGCLVAPFGGLSGVVYGLLGFFWMKSEFDPSFGFRMPLSVVIWAIAWFFLGVSNLDDKLLGFSMANWAHGAGFVCGILIGLMASTSSAKPKPNSSEDKK